jgi:nitroreductase
LLLRGESLKCDQPENMDKEAKTAYPINRLAAQRWSPRAFLDKPVEREKLISLFEAARWSASGGNEQPWRFILGLKPDTTWQKIFSCLNGANQVWNQQVPVLILACANKISTWDGDISPYFQYDTGQSAAHLSLEAMNQGLYVHQMGGFSAAKCRELFEVPDTFDVLTAIAVGYIGDPRMLPEKLKLRETEERTRKNLSELIFSGRFGEASSIIE